MIVFRTLPAETIVLFSLLSETLYDALASASVCSGLPALLQRRQSRTEPASLPPPGNNAGRPPPPPSLTPSGSRSATSQWFVSRNLEYERRRAGVVWEMALSTCDNKEKGLTEVYFEYLGVNSIQIALLQRRQS